MPSLLKGNEIVEDIWTLIGAGTGGELPAVPDHGDIIVPLSLWRAQRDGLLARDGRVGVWLDSHEDPAAIADDLAILGVIAINFPSHADGRGYSTARLLRERYGYQGELRAIGDVLRDQIFYLSRCGFDAFALAPGRDPQEALRALNDFSDAYQAAVDRPAPLFRRRPANAGAGANK